MNRRRRGIADFTPALFRRQGAAANSTSSASGSRTASSKNGYLPPLTEFSFAEILRTIDSDIQPSIDAISLICARSHFSLADEYSAHLPPLGEIRLLGSSSSSGAAASLPNPASGHGLWIRTAGLLNARNSNSNINAENQSSSVSMHALSVVQEQSSGSSSPSPTDASEVVVRDGTSSGAAINKGKQPDFSISPSPSPMPDHQLLLRHLGVHSTTSPISPSHSMSHFSQYSEYSDLLGTGASSGTSNPHKSSATCWAVVDAQNSIVLLGSNGSHGRTLPSRHLSPTLVLERATQALGGDLEPVLASSLPGTPGAVVSRGGGSGGGLTVMAAAMRSGINMSESQFYAQQGAMANWLLPWSDEPGPPTSPTSFATNALQSEFENPEDCVVQEERETLLLRESGYIGKVKRSAETALRSLVALSKRRQDSHGL